MMKMAWIHYTACLLVTLVLTISVCTAVDLHKANHDSSVHLYSSDSSSDSGNNGAESLQQAQKSSSSLFFNQALPGSSSKLYCNKTTGNSTNGGTYPTYVGFITAVVAVIFYGSNFVPVKQFETGDGMFFQWVMCAGIWLTGVILQAVRQSTFHPLAMLGGVIWATGNICVVPIVKTIGLGLGLCIWAMLNLLAGWAIGRFGFGIICPSVPYHEVINYIGVALAVSSSVIYAFIKNDIHGDKLELTIQVNDNIAEPLLENSRQQDMYGAVNPNDDVLVFNKRRSRSNSLSNSLLEQEIGGSWVDRLSPGQKRAVGLGLSAFSGLLYGSNFTPAFHIMDSSEDVSQNALDYVFAQYCGIYLTSTFFFLIYCAVQKNRPVLYPKVILPAIASGVMWAVATGCWFIANEALSEPVAFPIITTGPGAIASMFWGVIIFKEIKGRRNILILLIAVAVTITGAVLCGVSKG